MNGYNEQFNNSHEMTVEDIERDGQWWLVEHVKRSPQPDKWKKFKSIKNSVLIIQDDQDMIKFANAIHMNILIKGSQLCILPDATQNNLLINKSLTTNQKNTNE